MTSHVPTFYQCGRIAASEGFDVARTFLLIAARSHGASGCVDSMPTPMKPLLSHAAEEAAEFTQAAMKNARSDWGRRKLTDEAADLAAFLLVMQERGTIDPERFGKRLAMKVRKMRRKYGRR